METTTQYIIKQVQSGEANPLPKPGVLEVINKAGHPDAVKFMCPCGCEGTLYLPLVRPDRPRVAGAGPRWDWMTGGLLISPSVRDLGGCKAHYFIKADGRVDFCGDSGR